MFCLTEGFAFHVRVAHRLAKAAAVTAVVAAVFAVVGCRGDPLVR
jgi:hypothetical protein